MRGQEIWRLGQTFALLFCAKEIAASRINAFLPFAYAARSYNRADALKLIIVNY